MSRKDSIQKMQHVLVDQRDKLRTSLSGGVVLSQSYRAQSSGDMGDAAMATARDQVNFQLAEVESRELARVEHALEKMRDGTYGVCEGCGSNIPLDRLNALPYATYCVKCQREAERQGGTQNTADADWTRLMSPPSGGDHDAVGINLAR